MSDSVDKLKEETSKSPKKFRIRSVLEAFTGIALYLMVLFVFINAVLRYVFHSGWALSEELSRWLFVWVTFLGSIVAFADDKHVGVDLVINILGKHARFVWSMIGNLMALGAIAFALAGSWKYLMRTLTVPAPASRLPQGILTVSLFICMVSILIIYLQKIYKAVMAYKNGGKEVDK